MWRNYSWTAILAIWFILPILQNGLTIEHLPTNYGIDKTTRNNVKSTVHEAYESNLPCSSIKSIGKDSKHRLEDDSSKLTEYALGKYWILNLQNADEQSDSDSDLQRRADKIKGTKAISTVDSSMKSGTKNANLVDEVYHAERSTEGNNDFLRPSSTESTQTRDQITTENSLVYLNGYETEKQRGRKREDIRFAINSNGIRRESTSSNTNYNSSSGISGGKHSSSIGVSQEVVKNSSTWRKDVIDRTNANRNGRVSLRSHKNEASSFKELDQWKEHQKSLTIHETNRKGINDHRSIQFDVEQMHEHVNRNFVGDEIPFVLEVDGTTYGSIRNSTSSEFQTFATETQKSPGTDVGNPDVFVDKLETKYRSIGIPKIPLDTTKEPYTVKASRHRSFLVNKLKKRVPTKFRRQSSVIPVPYASWHDTVEIDERISMFDEKMREPLDTGQKHFTPSKIQTRIENMDARRQIRKREIKGTRTTAKDTNVFNVAEMNKKQKIKWRIYKRKQNLNARDTTKNRPSKETTDKNSMDDSPNDKRYTLKLFPRPNSNKIEAHKNFKIHRFEFTDKSKWIANPYVSIQPRGLNVFDRRVNKNEKIHKRRKRYARKYEDHFKGIENLEFHPKSLKSEEVHPMEKMYQSNEAHSEQKSRVNIDGSKDNSGPNILSTVSAGNRATLPASGTTIKSYSVPSELDFSEHPLVNRENSDSVSIDTVTVSSNSYTTKYTSKSQEDATLIMSTPNQSSLSHNKTTKTSVKENGNNHKNSTNAEETRENIGFVFTEEYITESPDSRKLSVRDNQNLTSENGPDYNEVTTKMNDEVFVRKDHASKEYEMNTSTVTEKYDNFTSEVTGIYSTKSSIDTNEEQNIQKETRRQEMVKTIKKENSEFSVSATKNSKDNFTNPSSTYDTKETDLTYLKDNTNRSVMTTEAKLDTQNDIRVTPESDTNNTLRSFSEIQSMSDVNGKNTSKDIKKENTSRDGPIRIISNDTNVDVEINFTGDVNSEKTWMNVDEKSFAINGGGNSFSLRNTSNVAQKQNNRDSTNYEVERNDTRYDEKLNDLPTNVPIIAPKDANWISNSTMNRIPLKRKKTYERLNIAKIEDNEPGDGFTPANVSMEDVKDRVYLQGKRISSNDDEGAVNWGNERTKDIKEDTENRGTRTYNRSEISTTPMVVLSEKYSSTRKERTSRSSKTRHPLIPEDHSTISYDPKRVQQNPATVSGTFAALTQNSEKDRSRYDPGTNATSSSVHSSQQTLKNGTLETSNVLPSKGTPGHSNIFTTIHPERTAPTNQTHKMSETTVRYASANIPSLSTNSSNNNVTRESLEVTSSPNKIHVLGYENSSLSNTFSPSSTMQPRWGVTESVKSRKTDNSTHDTESLNQWPVKHSAVVEGDLVLGGLMMVHEREDTITCGPVMPQGGVQALEAMLYTLDWVNKGDGIIPGVKIGAHILDDCDKDTYGLEMAVDFIKDEAGSKLILVGATT